MTSFSIYLGVIEHIYKPNKPSATRTVSRVVLDGRQLICLKVQQPHNATTTSDAAATKVVSCRDLGRAG
jgi:hypothetical protein